VTGLIAILRGVTPAEVVGVGRALVDAGFPAIEVPLNSPEPFESVRLLADAFGEWCEIGAGTVLTTADVGRAREAGARMIVAPNSDPAVISAAVTAQSPKRTSVSAKAFSVCIGTWPAVSWKMSGSGR